MMHHESILCGIVREETDVELSVPAQSETKAIAVIFHLRQRHLLAIAPSLECVRLMCAIRLGPCPRIMEAQVEKLIISEVDLHVVSHCSAAVFALWTR